MAIDGRREQARRRRVAHAAVTGILAALATAGLTVVGAAPALALEPVNPVTVPVGGHPANSGFLVFVEGNIVLHSDESEGTMAAGGNLTIQSNYNIAAGSAPVQPTFTAPGDARQTYLYVGGGINWDASGASVFVENQGFTKVGNPTT